MNDPYDPTEEFDQSSLNEWIESAEFDQDLIDGNPAAIQAAALGSGPDADEILADLEEERRRWHEKARQQDDRASTTAIFHRSKAEAIADAKNAIRAGDRLTGVRSEHAGLMRRYQKRQEAASTDREDAQDQGRRIGHEIVVSTIEDGIR